MQSSKLAFLWIAAALVIVPGSAAAQSGQTAEALEARAVELATEPARSVESAQLFMKAASLREAGDPAIVSNLRQAARLSWYGGRKSQARDAFALAAETALKYGDVLAAAESFLDAAWVANRMGDADRTLRWGRRAQDLARSPLLAEVDRERLLSRIVSERVG